MNGLYDLLKSERGVFSIIVLLCCTAMTLMGRLTPDEWMDYTKWLSTVLIASKTVTTAVETYKKP